MLENLTEEEKRGSNVDKFKNNSTPTPALVVKLVLVLVFLLTAAFVSGVMIGKNGRRSVDRTSSDEEGINEKLSNCIFNSDELREKYLKLRAAAREKGLVDENDVVNARVVCRPEEKPVEKPVELESVETSPETSPKNPEPAEPKPSESVETSPETSPKEPAKPAEQKPSENVETSPETSPKEPAKQAEPKPAKPEKTEKSDKNKTIDEILTEKKAEPAKEKGQTCRFSIQVFAASTREQADAAAKKLKSLKPRVISGESNGKQWFKLRSGCFDSREAAEARLPEVRKLEKSAYIVSE